MRNGFRLLGLFVICVLITGLISELAKAQGFNCADGNCSQDGMVMLTSMDTGARAFAAELSNDRFIHHDLSFNGAEVVFKTGGWEATPEEAIQAWQKSHGTRRKPGHAELLASGAITDIQCVGDSCVGRGPGLSSTGTASQGTCGITRGSGPIRRLVSRLLNR